MAQAIEIDVSATIDDDKLLAFDFSLRDVLLHAGDRERASGLDDRAGILENILDAGTNLVGVDRDDFIDMRFTQAERLVADPLYRDTVGKDPDVIEYDRFACRNRLASSPMSRPARRRRLSDLAGMAFRYVAIPRDESAATDRDEHCCDVLTHLLMQFLADRALAGDDGRVVERMNEGQPLSACSSLAFSKASS